jgi:homoserine/homoserine lactone efflux protein
LIPRAREATIGAPVGVRPVINLHLYLTFVVATVALILLPGPNVALIVANSVAYGTRFGLLTVLGTSTAMVIQLALTALGMAALLGEAGAWFGAVRWVGAIYLLWIGFMTWRATPVDRSKVPAQPRSPRRIFLRGLLVSLTNPKTLLFYGAFFPQFVTPGPQANAQVALLSATFIVIAVTLDSVWATLAGRARRFLAVRGKLRNRVSGGLLMGAGLGLALARPK